jgi:hypothetical protein
MKFQVVVDFTKQQAKKPQKFRNVRCIAGSLARTGLVLILLIVGYQPVHGLAQANRLATTTIQVLSTRISNLAPGDTQTITLWIRNESDESFHYQLVFIEEGDLWDCDLNDNNLTYTTIWGPGTNQYLEPGEMETANIEIHLPLAAGNACQGLHGTLTVRQSSGSISPQNLSYRCRETVLVKLRNPNRSPNEYLDGYYCRRISIYPNGSVSNW